MQVFSKTSLFTKHSYTSSSHALKLREFKQDVYGKNVFHEDSTHAEMRRERKWSVCVEGGGGGGERLKGGNSSCEIKSYSIP